MAVRFDKKSEQIDQIVRYVIEDDLYRHTKVDANGIKEHVDFVKFRDSARLALRTQLEEAMDSIDEENLGEWESDFMSIFTKKDFMNTLKRAFLKSFVAADFSAGFETAFAVGSNATQQTLNSFHRSGALKETDGAIAGIVNIAEGSSNPKKSITNVLFEASAAPTSFYDILKNKRKDFVETRFGFYIESEEVVNLAQLIDQDRDPMWWYQAYGDSLGKDIIEEIAFSRDFDKEEFVSRAEEIYLASYKIDVDKMFSFEITPVEIVRKLTKVASGKFLFVCSPLLQEKVEVVTPTIQPDSSVTEEVETVIRPTCYVHCYALHKQHLNLDLSQPALEISLLQTNGLKVFEKKMISGIENVRQVEPDVIDITMMINDCVRVLEDCWNCYFDPIRLGKFGVTIQRIVQLLEAFGFSQEQDLETVFDKTDSFFVEGEGVYDLIITINSKNNPQTQMYQQVAQEKKKVQLHVNNMLKQRTRLYNEGKRREAYELDVYNVKGVSKIRDLNEIYFAKTIGANLIKFWKVPGVDPYHTFSGHFHEVNFYLGVEATRNILGVQFQLASGYGGYIDPRHVLTVIDRICHPAYIRGFSRGKFDRENYSALTRFLLGSPSVVMGQSAAMGESHQVLSPIESVMVGGDPNFGTTSKSTRIEFDEDFEQIIKEKKAKVKKTGPGKLSKNVIKFNIVDDYVDQKQIVISTPEGKFETTKGGSIQPIEVPEEEKIFVRSKIPARTSIYGDLVQLAREENQPDLDEEESEEDEGEEKTFQEFVRLSQQRLLGRPDAEKPHVYQSESNEIEKVPGIDLDDVLGTI